MHRTVQTSMFICLLVFVTPAFSVRAASQAYNDSHGRWSLVLPDTYRHTSDRYNQGDTQHPGFTANTEFASRSGAIAVGYVGCCRPDAEKRIQIAQANFDVVRTTYPDATIGVDGIQQTMLSNRPALQYDIFYKEQDIPIHARAIIAFSGFLSYSLYFAARADGFDALQSEFAAIADSFRFTVRSVVAGVYTDPQGRFIFTPPLGYDTVPNFDGQISDQEESGVTLAPNPMPDDDRDPFMAVKTFAENRTFDAVFDVYATAGLRSLAAHGAELGPEGLRRTTVDGRAAGIEDFYEQSDASVRFHVYQVFTVIGGLQYAIDFAFPDDTYGSPGSLIDTTLASFHFQVSG